MPMMLTDRYGPMAVTDRERRLVAALAEDPIYNTDAQLELCFGPSVGRVVAEMRRAVRDYDAENRRIDAEVSARFKSTYPEHAHLVDEAEQRLGDLIEVSGLPEDVEPTCDVCGRRVDDSPAGFADADWNGETGCHETCEDGASQPSLADVIRSGGDFDPVDAQRKGF